MKLHIHTNQTFEDEAVSLESAFNDVSAGVTNRDQALDMYNLFPNLVNKMYPGVSFSVANSTQNVEVMKDMITKGSTAVTIASLVDELKTLTGALAGVTRDKVEARIDKVKYLAESTMEPPFKSQFVGVINLTEALGYGETKDADL